MSDLLVPKKYNRNKKDCFLWRNQNKNMKEKTKQKNRQHTALLEPHGKHHIQTIHKWLPLVINCQVDLAGNLPL